MTLTHLQQLGFEVITHPAYSPDLSPSDFHLFRSLEHYLADKIYHSNGDIANDLQAFFDSKDKHFLKRDFVQLPQRWENCLAAHGDYFDC